MGVWAGSKGPADKLAGFAGGENAGAEAMVDREGHSGRPGRASMYQYDHPHPAVTTDCVIFGIQGGQLTVLLIQRAKAPDKGCWALPGGFLEPDETLHDCAARELREETGLTDIELHQFHAFGAPDRDPRERIVTVAYYSLVDPAVLPAPAAADDAAAVAWFPVSALPELAVDHDEVIAKAHARMVLDIDATGLAAPFVGDAEDEDRVQQFLEILFIEPGPAGT